MKLEYDKEVDAAYIYLEDKISNGRVKKTIELNDNIIIDFSSEGKLLGIEVLNASKVLNKELILQSK